ncbi:D-isomer specific 2-hydroxyacid dehydrogenase family protein [Antiquaquibacter soli]|uniref:D-isomer specific 2-hydroxyacid dehydrogenase family protein n=1 Tax=Antiquaquibacter soli TaxID=3064523 RepID=A0ABT9BM93_9MICO|nr:D-isomer specific 2-hydroxyacid dehydrogenase family protein [Protaetiibacter sp. WY-16]MDO7882156.1 D-isomer specific 2-hydroxyacid dehydrogenase family protein [Protaetiibacter sp. WY-16]
MTSRQPGEHKDPLAAAASPLPAELRPHAGPIAILPEPTAAIESAVRDAGGTVAPLGDDTKAVVWLSGPSATLRGVLAEHPGVEWVQLPLAGVESHAGLFSDYADKTYPLWTSAKGAYSEPVAEHALALTLGMLRQLPDKARSASWQVPRQGLSLYGMRVAIVGAGGIAVELIRLLEPFETHITIVRRSPGDVPGADRTVTSDRLAEVLAESDVVVLAAATTDESRKMIGAEELAAMKPTAVLVNIARGALIDSDALLASLDSGHLWGVGLDVTDPEPLPDGHPLWNHPRCVVTSHSADTDEQVEPLLAARVRHNVAALLGGGDFIGIVDPGARY